MMEANVVPINDRGFLYGDGVFETIRVENSTPIWLNLHIQRLESGLKELYILNVSISNIKVRICTAAREIHRGLLRVVVTRGIGGSGYAPPADQDVIPGIYVEKLPMRKIPIGDISLCMASDDAMTHRSFKSLSSIDFVLNRRNAVLRGFYDVLLYRAHDTSCKCILGTSSSNVFWVKDNTLITPMNNTTKSKINDRIFPGVVRNIIMNNHSIVRAKPCNDITRQDDTHEYYYSIFNADEVFITNVSNLVLKIDKIYFQDDIIITYTKNAITIGIQEFLRHDIECQIS